MTTLAVYAGTFDPFTFGHIDIARRAHRLFPGLVIAVSTNPEKAPLFSLAERQRIIRNAVRGMRGVSIDSFDGLLVDYMRRRGAHVVIRGLRALSDFEYEFQMALMNRKLNDEIETVFLMPHERYSYLSSRLVKEIALLGGDVSQFVTPMVEQMLKERMSTHPKGERR
ncbi:phosphopantetheine adenylyltransferase [Candidatus Methylomirabilis lanthanidiphila]|uniref:Phosphopantetheine adenylyltransferase n=1 Tax=Candidatus Methylomirabilis lanthanidiphila TaxID=2211376 RepID=A0A564ZFR2_9BACT|nr:pantetheine-phosphate adenylyltransferase [Candidatus Methylomirabilis lanthanidiphila]VUZ83976.1 phosphopantetheine adenylyltransferase [Candidatus Methylomirabilis lanthanidiphila]